MVNKAIIFAAGKGTRMYPLTQQLPKEMLPVVDKPVLQLVVEEVFLSGIRDICIVISPTKEIIRNYFDKNATLASYQEMGFGSQYQTMHNLLQQVKVTFVVQQSVTGTAKALQLCQGFADGQSCAVLNADDVIFGSTPVTAQLVDVHNTTNATILGCQQVSREDIVHYACCQTQLVDGSLKVVGLVEKPTPSQVTSLLAPLGRYVVTPQIWQFLQDTPLRDNGEAYLTDTFDLMCRKAHVVAHQFDGLRFDFGNKQGYNDGVQYYIKHIK